MASLKKFVNTYAKPQGAMEWVLFIIFTVVILGFIGFLALAYTMQKH